MDKASLINLYFHLYPVLLMYGGSKVPIIPVNTMFDHVESKVWEKLLLKFSKLLRLIVNSQQIDDALKTPSDIVAFRAANMFQSCLSLTEKKDMPKVIRKLLGGPLRGGSLESDSKDTEFDLHEEFERMSGGGGNGSPNEIVSSSSSSAISSSGSSGVGPLKPIGPMVARVLEPRELTVGRLLEVGVNADNAAAVVHEATAAVQALHVLTQAREYGELAPLLSEHGDYSTANLKEVLARLSSEVDTDINKLQRFAASLKGREFNITNLNRPAKSGFFTSSSAVNFSNIRGNNRLTKLVRLIDGVLKRNPVLTELTKAKREHTRRRDELYNQMRNRLLFLGISAATIAGVIYSLNQPDEVPASGAASAPIFVPSPSVQAAPSMQPSAEPLAEPSAEPVVMPSPTETVTSAGIMGTMSAAGSWVSSMVSSAASSTLSAASSAASSALSAASSAGSAIGSTVTSLPQTIATGTRSAVRESAKFVVGLAGEAASGAVDATGIPAAIGAIDSARTATITLLRQNFGRLRNAAYVLGAGGASVLGVPLILSYRQAQSNLFQLEKDEKELLSKFRETFVALLITNYTKHVKEELKIFNQAIIENRHTFAMVLRGRKPMEGMKDILNQFESELQTSVEEASFLKLALLMPATEYSNFQREMYELLQANRKISMDILKSYFTQVSTTEGFLKEMNMAPLKVVRGLTFLLSGVVRGATGAASNAVALAAGAAMGGGAGALMMASARSPVQERALRQSEQQQERLQQEHEERLQDYAHQQEALQGQLQLQQQQLQQLQLQGQQQLQLQGQQQLQLQGQQQLQMQQPQLQMQQPQLQMQQPQLQLQAPLSEESHLLGTALVSANPELLPSAATLASAAGGLAAHTFSPAASAALLAPKLSSGQRLGSGLKFGSSGLRFGSGSRFSLPSSGPKALGMRGFVKQVEEQAKLENKKGGTRKNKLRTRKLRKLRKSKTRNIR